jgi:serine/threonine-protein kinase
VDRTVTIVAGPDPDATTDQRSRPAPPAVARLIIGTGQGAEDLTVLLRRRLRLLLLLGALGTAALFVAFLVKPPPPSVLRDRLVLLVVLAAALAALWSRVPLTLGQLRGIELLSLGALTAYYVWGVLSEKVDPLTVFSSYLADNNNVGFMLIAFGYGVFIPNTWRRCLLVLSGIVAVAVGSQLYALTRQPLPDGYLGRYVVEVSIILGIPMAFAVYGAHRLSILRQGVIDAHRLGQYVLREKLGSGGMGEVYRAEHALLRRPCAIKLIRPEKAGDPATLERFEREVQATAALTHPNTVQVFDYGRADDGTFYYVMEYLPGVTLDRLVAAEGPLPPARAVRLLRQVCGALAEAHAAGLVHRDVKPGNIMVGERGGRTDVAKLLDFGLVLPAEGDGDGRLTQVGAVAGTPQYMSPEQAGGDDAPGPPADVYAVGAVAYFLLAGRPPFTGRGGVKLLAAHLHETPEPPSAHRAGLPADLEAVVLRCLAKRPADRYPTAGDLAAALAACGCAGSAAERGAGARPRAEPVAAPDPAT